jgi:hypothetical protein
LRCGWYDGRVLGQARSIVVLMLLACACSYEFIETGTSGENDEAAEVTGTSGAGETGDVDTEGPLANCGDGTRQTGESCDGEDLGEVSCNELGFEKGTLACTDTCAFDVTDCTGIASCGDGTASSNEECDGEDFKGRSCTDLGFTEGALACTEQCTVDTSGCV